MTRTVQEAKLDTSLAPIVHELLDHFPGEQIRPAQERSLVAWGNAITRDKDFAIMEIPTGGGKSYLAWTAAIHAARVESQATDPEPDPNANITPAPAPSKYRPGGYILTTQKSLQAQYMRDFASMGMRDLMGAANYRCHDYETNCQDGALRRKADKDMGHTVPKCDSCEYKTAKNSFAMSEVGVTNFAYFLSETQHVGTLRPREVLVVDEAHNTETQLLEQVAIEITRHRCDGMGTDQPPRVKDGDVTTAKEWLLGTFVPQANIYLSANRKALEEITDTNKRAEALKRYNYLESFVKKVAEIETFDLADWYCHTDDKGSLRLRPLTAASFAQKMLFNMGRRTLFLSATILDAPAFARGLGIEPQRGGVVKVDSDFPLKNRPIYLRPIGSMSFKNREKTLPAMLRAIESILDKHPDEKGIIHTQSYALNNAIRAHLDGTPHASRLLSPETGFANKLAALEEHARTSHPTVLLSPSMTEGLDLFGDLSRFQICPKAPFPALGDPFIRARKERDASWYTWQTALTIMQATGRSIRSREDYAETYFLDTDFNYFLQQADAILPPWWKASIHHS